MLEAIFATLSLGGRQILDRIWEAPVPGKARFLQSCVTNHLSIPPP